MLSSFCLTGYVLLTVWKKNVEDGHVIPIGRPATLFDSTTARHDPTRPLLLPLVPPTCPQHPRHVRVSHPTTRARKVDTCVRSSPWFSLRLVRR